jgi:hypothetical protein
MPTVCHLAVYRFCLLMVFGLLIVPVASAQFQLDGTNSQLLGWWRFEETSGTNAYDSSGNGRTGVLMYGTTRVAGRTGTGALAFDGVSNYVRIASSTNFDFPGDFSVSAWVLSHTNPSSPSRFTAVGRAKNNLWHLWVLDQINTSRLDMELVDKVGVGESAHRSNGSGLGFSTGAWHHVVGVKSGIVVQVYVDGKQGTVSSVISNPPLNLVGQPITIGARRSNVPDANWPGYIDDVRIYNRALSLAEIRTLGDCTPPTVTVFSIPPVCSNLTVPVTSLMATDGVGVVGYLLSESGATPSPDAPGWSVSPASSHTFSADGTRTVYAWARDAAGNVSSGVTASVTITVQPAFHEARMTTGNLVVTFDTLAGKTYILEQSTNLTTWTDLLTNGPMLNSGLFTNTIPIEAWWPIRFFRLGVEP